MTKNEALKAAIDGKKVRNERWVPECYLCFKENQFFVIGPSAPEGNSLHANGLNYSTGKWQIVPEYVDFAYAWKAYEDGKKVQSFKGYVYEKLLIKTGFKFALQWTKSVVNGKSSMTDNCFSCDYWRRVTIYDTDRGRRAERACVLDECAIKDDGEEEKE